MHNSYVKIFLKIPESSKAKTKHHNRSLNLEYRRLNCTICGQATVTTKEMVSGPVVCSKCATLKTELKDMFCFNQSYSVEKSELTLLNPQVMGESSTSDRKGPKYI